LYFEDKFYSDVAKIAIKQKLGARSIKSVVEYSVMNIMFRAPELQKNGVVKVVFDNYPISLERPPTLVYSDGRTHKDTEYKIYRGLNEKTTLE
jgi:ATP-dependent protease Clp ATPase subunit